MKPEIWRVIADLSGGIFTGIVILVALARIGQAVLRKRLLRLSAEEEALKKLTNGIELLIADLDQANEAWETRSAHVRRELDALGAALREAENKDAWTAEQAAEALEDLKRRRREINEGIGELSKLHEDEKVLLSFAKQGVAEQKTKAEQLDRATRAAIRLARIVSVVANVDIPEGGET